MTQYTSLTMKINVLADSLKKAENMLINPNFDSKYFGEFQREKRNFYVTFGRRKLNFY